MDKVLDAELRQRVLSSIADLLPRVLNREVPAVLEEIRLFDELGLSSSKTLELLLALEEDLAIQVDVDEIDRGDLVSVGAFANFVAQHSTPL